MKAIVRPMECLCYYLGLHQWEMALPCFDRPQPSDLPVSLLGKSQPYCEDSFITLMVMHFFVECPLLGHLRHITQPTGLTHWHQYSDRSLNHLGCGPTLYLRAAGLLAQL